MDIISSGPSSMAPFSSIRTNRPSLVRLITQHRQKRLVRPHLLPLFFVMVVLYNNEGIVGNGVCSAAEALVVPFLHKRILLNSSRGGSLASPKSSTCAEIVDPSIITKNDKKPQTGLSPYSSMLHSSTKSSDSQNDSKEDISGETNLNGNVNGNINESLIKRNFSASRNGILKRSLNENLNGNLNDNLKRNLKRNLDENLDEDLNENLNGNLDEKLNRNLDENFNLNLNSEEADALLVTRFIAETSLPTNIGHFRLRAYRICSSTKEGILNEYVGKEPCVIYAKNHPPGKTNKGSSGTEAKVPIRIHDQCFTSEVFGSRRCDCRDQLVMALKYIHKNGGALIYLQQEGRGIGIANKVAAYALQDIGFDTVEANIHLGFPEDCRQYGVVPSILEDMGIESIQLMTNNPRKVKRLKQVGVDVVNTVPMVVERPNKYNRKYLETKKERMNHKNFGEMLNLSNHQEVDDPVNQILSGIASPPTEEKINSTKGTRHNGILINGGASHMELTKEDLSQTGVHASEDGYCFGRKSVEDAIAAVARGELVVVVDDENRENEGDFIMAGDLATPETMATIVRYSSGVICLAMEGKRMDELQLPPMVVNNEDPKGTAFTVTVDAAAKHGITTGISASDRARTIRLLSSEKSTVSDFNRPGHIFPLRAKENGVLSRDGHTEASIDLSRLAGCSSSGVLCEIVSEENPTEMARLPELKRFCKRHGYVLTSIVDLAQYRRDTE